MVAPADAMTSPAPAPGSEFAELRSALERATPGPWWACLGGDQPVAYYAGLVAYISSSPSITVVTGEEGDKAGHSTNASEWPHNAAFIARARNDLPELIAAYDARGELLDGFLRCPEIADCHNEDKDPDTHRLESRTRAHLAGAPPPERGEITFQADGETSSLIDRLKEELGVDTTAEVFREALRRARSASPPERGESMACAERDARGALLGNFILRDDEGNTLSDQMRRFAGSMIGDDADARSSELTPYAETLRAFAEELCVRELAAIDRLSAEREGEANAKAWHRCVETICTVIGADGSGSPEECAEACRSRWEAEQAWQRVATASIEYEQSQKNAAREALALILPLARGYRVNGQTETARATCDAWIAQAEAVLAEAPPPSIPSPDRSGEDTARPGGREDEAALREGTPCGPRPKGVAGSNPAPAATHTDRSGELEEAARDVIAERRRQVEVEGWTPEHDNAHDQGAMALAAAAYAIQAAKFGDYEQIGFHYESAPAQPPWPWEDRWWKPKDPRRDLVRAGALILAEIERLDRTFLTRPAPSPEPAPESAP